MTARPSPRLNRLKQLIAEYDTIVAVAEAAGVSEKYLSQILNGTPLPSGNPRGVGDALATKLELGCGKTIGWMDTLDGPGKTPERPAPLQGEEAELIRRFKATSAKHRTAILAVARLKAD